MEQQTGPDPGPAGQDWVQDGGSGLAWLRGFAGPDKETAADAEAAPDAETVAGDADTVPDQGTGRGKESAPDDTETRQDVTRLTTAGAELSETADTELSEDDAALAGPESAHSTAAETARAELAETRVTPRAEGAGPDEAATSFGPAASQVPAEPVPQTGEPRVDAALRLLERLPGLPVSDHPELFEQVHAQLAEVLSDLGSGLPGGPADSPRS